MKKSVSSKAWAAFICLTVSFLAGCARPHLVDVPGLDVKIMNTEITQKMYKSVMGDNPSRFAGKLASGWNPVESVSWFDAVVFCNKYSVRKGLVPVYSLNGTTDVSQWNYTPHKGQKLSGKILEDPNADGFRLPTEEEWIHAAKGGQDYIYAGSNLLGKVAWYSYNSGLKPHAVGLKKANGYRLHDMCGNVLEWCWGPQDTSDRYSHGGAYDYYGCTCKLDHRYVNDAWKGYPFIGFRVVCKK